MLCRHLLIVYAFQNDDGMLRLILSDRMCCTREMMASHALGSLIASIAQSRYGMPRLMSSDRVLLKGHVGMPHLTSSNYLCSPKGVTTFHVDVVQPCAFQG